MGGWVYIMTNRRNGTLYIGITSDLIRRVWEHRERVGSSFVRRYDPTSLVYFEHHEDIRDAIQRETSLKRWPGAWKVAGFQIRNGTIFTRLSWVEDVDGRHEAGHDVEWIATESLRIPGEALALRRFRQLPEVLIRG